MWISTDKGLDRSCRRRSSTAGLIILGANSSDHFQFAASADLDVIIKYDEEEGSRFCLQLDAVLKPTVQKWERSRGGHRRCPGLAAGGEQVPLSSEWLNRLSFQLTPESSANQAMQTRVFRDSHRSQLLSASAAALQDLGFQIERGVGRWVPAGRRKNRCSRGVRAVPESVFVWLLTLGHILGSIDLHQKIAAPSWPGPSPKTTREARGADHLLSRGVERGRAGRPQLHPAGRTTNGMIRDQDIYQQFFAKLSGGLPGAACDLRHGHMNWTWTFRAMVLAGA